MEPLEVDKITVHVLVDFECDPYSTAPKFQNYVPEGQKWGWNQVKKYEEALMLGNIQDTSHAHTIPTSIDCIGGKHACCASTGFAYLMEIYKGDEKHTIMFDAGPSSLTIDNVNKMGLNLGNVTDIVFSHRHWDHCGGILSVLDKISSDSKEKKTVNIHAHNDVFVESGRRLKTGLILRQESCCNPEVILQHNGEVHFSKTAKLIANGTVLISGEVPRITEYEKGIAEQVTKRITETGSVEWFDDPLLMEEQFLVVKIKDKGICVFSACSHAGIVNVTSHATSKLCSPRSPLYLVMGGLHLIGNCEPIIQPTVRDLLSFKPQYICAGHCTGYKAKAELRNCFGDNFHTTPTGCTFEFPTFT